MLGFNAVDLPRAAKYHRDSWIPGEGQQLWSQETESQNVKVTGSSCCPLLQGSHGSWDGHHVGGHCCHPRSLSWLVCPGVIRTPGSFGTNRVTRVTKIRNAPKGGRALEQKENFQVLIRHEGLECIWGFFLPSSCAKINTIFLRSTKRAAV